MKMIEVPAEVPNCPRCEAQMVFRSGKFGDFWGCSRFPDCRGIRDYVEIPKELRKIENPSLYQQRIFDWLVGGLGNAIVNAVAGSGKTTTIEHAIALVKEAFPNANIIYAVFNAHVKNSAVEKGLPAATTHQMGFAAIRDYVRGKVELKEDKVRNIVKSLVRSTWDEEKWMISPVCQLVSKLKNTLAPTDDSTLDKIADRFGIETNGSKVRIYQLVRSALTRNNSMTRIIDYDDMIYLPWKLKMTLVKYDWIFGDEVQDWNRAQIQLVLNSIKPGGRVLAVGDRNQSMYGFRGADIMAMDNIKESLRAIEMPLSITYRCPVAHVAFVNQLFPEITFEQWENAKVGELLSISKDRMLGQVKDRDLVLCRTNAPLVKPVFALIRRGVKAIIRGRDIGANIIALIEKFEEQAKYNVDDLIEILTDYQAVEIDRLIRQEQMGQAQSLDDKIKTIFALTEGCNKTTEIKQKIDEVFTDSKEGVVFSTVHRAKGDEAENVYILEPQLMPHPMAQQDWEVQQEKNILYVAITRAKSTLTFVGGPAPSPIWAELDTEEEELTEPIEISEVVAAVEELLDTTFEEVHEDVVFEISDKGIEDVTNRQPPVIGNCPF